MKSRNIFLMGLSGAGKDTIAQHLRDNLGYRIVRLSTTVKNLVYETFNFKTVADYEEAKRKFSYVRKAHNNIGDEYDTRGEFQAGTKSSDNRLTHIINNELIENDMVLGFDQMPIVIPDIRKCTDASRLLEYGWVGVMLGRRNYSEYRNAKHHTEEDIIGTPAFDYLREENGLIYIDNDSIEPRTTATAPDLKSQDIEEIQQFVTNLVTN